MLADQEQAVADARENAELPAPYFADEARDIRLYHGDAMELLRAAPRESFDLIFADPPYFLSGGSITCQSGHMVSVGKGLWDKPTTFEEMHAFNREWLGLCRKLLKPNGTLWVTGTLHNIYSVGFALQTLGYKILNDIAWHKVNPPPHLACRYFTHAHETVLWTRRDPQARHLFHYAEMKAENNNKQIQSVWHIKPLAPWEKRHGKHPTQKPEALLDRILRASSSEGDTVLDPFCGSGTTGVVAARLGRRFVGIDQEAAYLDIATVRLTDELCQVRLVFAVSLTRKDNLPERTSKTEPSRWADIIASALKELGGEAHLKEINHIVERHPKVPSCKTWPCTVRRVVRQSDRFEPLGRGRYKLLTGYE